MSDTNDTIVYDSLDRGTAQVLEVRRCGFPVLGAPCSRVVGHEGACVPTVLHTTRQVEFIEYDNFDTATSVKWCEGRDIHGPVWVGKEPVVEAYEETCDISNYLEEDERRYGVSPLSLRAHTLTRELAATIQLLHRSRQP